VRQAAALFLKDMVGYTLVKSAQGVAPPVIYLNISLYHLYLQKFLVSSTEPTLTQQQFLLMFIYFLFTTEIDDDRTGITNSHITPVLVGVIDLVLFAGTQKLHVGASGVYITGQLLPECRRFQ
jgi:hypothetical protein